MPVYDHEYFSSSTAPEVLEKLHKPPGVEHPAVNFAPKSTAGTERADGVDFLTLAGGTHHRSLPFKPNAFKFGRARFLRKPDYCTCTIVRIVS